MAMILLYMYLLLVGRQFTMENAELQRQIDIMKDTQQEFVVEVCISCLQFMISCFT